MSEALATQLAGVLGVSPKPVPFDRAVTGWSTVNGDFAVDQAGLAKALRAESPAAPLRRVFRERLAHWDHVAAESVDWAGDTVPNTEARRQLVYTLLELEAELQAAIVDLLPPLLTDERNVVISRSGWNPWYDEERRVESRLYWSHYSRYLREVRRWEPENVEALDEATDSIVERLADPRQEENRATRGLVVGHVQSGKTANLTGVIAKAADAGYRLVIVLSGTTDLLRNQTQRRLDKELIGKEHLRPTDTDPPDEELDYQDDAEWDRFISHGGRPSELGFFDWIRLTGEEFDYRRLKAGIETLEFGRLDPTKPFFAAQNLQHAPAKIMVIKKQSRRLTNVLGDLQRIRTRLADVPALVIDDESDQASINTSPPSRQDQHKRTRINGLIVDLLEMLPRAQYVGYTATPFANVLIPARDEVDLFPRDFIVSLRPPHNYMGARAFHDLDGEPIGAEEDPYASNRKAFVRNVSGLDEVPSNLPKAIDSFVLAGALKLYREAQGVKLPTRHHTMLIHSSRLTADHAERSRVARKLFDQAGFATAGGASRLESLLWEDFAPVAESRAPDLAFPSRWSDFAPHVGEAIARIRDGEGPVIVVNGTDESEDPDFDRTAVWKIVIGGAKLSRGYTIEGLTTSYFRRRATTGDALMQMGRWFGYRENYVDLVRLFVSREEQAGNGRRYDLYEAFEGVCRDEEAFRAQLQRYALADDKEQPPLTPFQIPPLVYSHLSWLPPVADNKRANASVSWENFGGEWAEPTLAPLEVDRIRHNSELFREVLGRVDLERTTLRATEGSFEAVTGDLTPQDLIELVGGYRWAASFAPVTRLMEFLVGRGDKDPEIDRWVLIAPQLKRRSRTDAWPVGDFDLSIKFRSRSLEGRVKAYSEPLHREVAEGIALGGKGRREQELAGPRSGAILFYPTHHLHDDEEVPEGFIPTMGFALLPPENRIRKRVIFTTTVEGEEPFLPAAG